MSFDKLMLNRPNYTAKKILSPLFASARPLELVLTPTLNKTENKDRPSNFIDTYRKNLHQKHDSNKSQSINIKKQRVQDAYNSLSDFNDKKQIIASLKTLNSADERIQLIDKILERKDEMMVAQLKLKAVKLEPIFNVIRRKLRKQRLGSATPNQSKKGTVIMRQKTSEDLAKTNTDQTRDNKEKQDHSLQQQETMIEDQIIEKLQAKFTAGVAFSWLANRHDTKQGSSTFLQILVQLDPDPTERQYLRRSTALQYGKNTMNRLKQQVSKKVSENSDELIRLGNYKQEPKKEKNDLSKIKAKVDSGLIKPQHLALPNVNIIKRQDTLAYVTSERKEISTLGEIQALRSDSKIRFQKL
ncbi:unnamed protein product (macronuclear) [Paramecium tetraurelia]|uniref:Uncharacterized protein n=1 Tax=Paramecium tetraurelia TaxID=5888 RepID=A0C4M7_PARTE|nr:uncharacterized protein GSPATT00006243001 [Paramecium tetraurelia]CAK65744.1 unnamed protein product [Paramecium tetraurelia]|eukprot:XP_001433141.1 hypothetical protein (macronuclear) [Paramecium tetraurelia strain d4-2]